MTSLLTLLNRFEDAAGTYERCDTTRTRDELHAARRAIVEREAELVAALRGLTNSADGLSFRENGMRAVIGNTNWNVLRNWIEEARKVLPSTTS